jgi:hypothetical protein
VLFRSSITGIYRRPLLEMPVCVLYKSVAKSAEFAINGSVLKYKLERETFVSLKIYDIRGRLIAEKINNIQKAGSYSLPLEMSGFAPGKHILVFNAGRVRTTQGIMVIR